jgi:hypothetical protein
VESKGHDLLAQQGALKALQEKQLDKMEDED